jgi:2-oxoglutarate ferredoxin oxidoreductase subunit delta
MNKIVIDTELCKGCKLCISACPFQLIEMTEEFNSKGLQYAEFKDENKKCTACKSCAVICPDIAITVHKG